MIPVTKPLLIVRTHFNGAIRKPLPLLFNYNASLTLYKILTDMNFISTYFLYKTYFLCRLIKTADTKNESLFFCDG
jgi:hypothetical protein